MGMKYYQGTRSPNNAEREEKGYSSAWLHHKGRNKHHYEYWQDYGLDGQGALVPVPMPDVYFAEMIMDRIAASKVYQGSAYTDEAPLAYLHKGAKHPSMHPETEAKLEFILEMLAQKGEEETFRYIKDVYVKHKKP